MSVTVGFNIVDEKLLLQQLRGATDREKYDSLVARIGRTEPLFKGRPRSTPCETALLFRLTVR